MMLNPTFDEKRIVLSLEDDLDEGTSPLDPGTKLFAIYAPVRKTIVVRHAEGPRFRTT